MIRDTVWRCDDIIKVYTNPGEADGLACDFIGHVVSDNEDPFVLVYPPWALALIADVAFTERVIVEIRKQSDKILPGWLFKLSTL